MSKQAKKQAVKPAVKQTAKRKSTLSKAQISEIARFAAFKAHCHKSFQADRSPADRKAQVQQYNAKLRTAPAFIRSRFEPISA
jgi:hypothetical protein